MSDLGPGFQCAYCGEWNQTSVDLSAGRRQKYVEDCQVCCRANLITAEWDPDLHEYVLRADLE